MRRHVKEHRGHETTELQNQTNVFGQSFAQLQHHATLVDDQQCTQSWAHHSDVPLLPHHENEWPLSRMYRAVPQGTQTPYLFPMRQRTHCVRRERHVPRWPHSVPKQQQEECCDCQERPLRDAPPDVTIRRPRLRKMWLQCRQKNSCHLSCHLCV